MNRKNIIWDFDGTLYDTYGDIVKAFKSVLEKKDIWAIESDRIYELVKVDTKHCSKVLSAELGIEQTSLLASARAAYDALETSEQLPISHTRGICEEIIASGGKNFLVTHRDRKSLDPMLAEHDFHSLFTEIITSDDGYAQKPSPDSFNYIIIKYDLALASTYGIGDRELDVLAANASGISSVYFSARGGKHQSATINVSSFESLATLISQT